MVAKKTKSRSNTPASNMREAGSSIGNSPPRSFQQPLKDAFEDVHTRFLLNLPADELATSDRIFFQIEQAWWFYEDFLRADEDDDDEEKSKLPRFKNLHVFAREMFRFSPILQPLLPQFDVMWAEFSEYRKKISSYGTILLNADCTKVVLVQSFNSSSWTFPAGKVNQRETGTDAGARETYEETGFDPNCNFGMTKDMAAACELGGLSLTWSPLREEDALVYFEEGKQRTCYVCKGVPESFPFAPVARKEIGDVAFFELDQLPKRTYAVLPFLSQLKRWIQKDKKRGEKKQAARKDQQYKCRSNSAGSELSNKRSERSSSRQASRSRIRADIESLMKSGLATNADETGWSVDEMFRVNESIIGRKIEYDGNPYIFATKGFDGNDPHAFRVVGGKFMNSDGHELAPAPDRSKLQPIFRQSRTTCKDDDLQPFFSDDGAAPWDDSYFDRDKETSAKETSTDMSISEQQGSLDLYPDTSILKGQPDEGEYDERSVSTVNSDDFMNIEKDEVMQSTEVGSSDSDESQYSDASHEEEIYNHSLSQEVGAEIELCQEEVSWHQDDFQMCDDDGRRSVSSSLSASNTSEQGENENLVSLRAWLASLPATMPSSLFGDFRFDTEAIMTAMKQTL